MISKKIWKLPWLFKIPSKYLPESTDENYDSKIIFLPA
jgi:hypothetical protein